MKIDSGNIAGIVLAAGKGKRIGENKALLKFDGVSFLEIVLSCLRDAGCNPILVVGGSNAETVKRHTQNLGAEFELNINWRKGQFSSLKAGLSRLDLRVKGAMVVLVDHPFVTLNTYRKLLSAFGDFPNKIVMPLYNGRRGHPVIIPREIIKEVLQSPDSLNLRNIIHGHEEMIIKQEVDDSGVLRDIDTIIDLKREINRQAGLEQE